MQDGLAVMGKYPCLVNPLSTLNLLNVVWFLFRPATYIWASQTSRRITARAQSTNQHQQRAKYPQHQLAKYPHCQPLWPTSHPAAQMLPPIHIFCIVLPRHMLLSSVFFAQAPLQKASKKPAFPLPVSDSNSFSW